MGGAKWSAHRGESGVLTICPLPLFSHPGFATSQKSLWWHQTTSQKVRFRDAYCESCLTQTCPFVQTRLMSLRDRKWMGDQMDMTRAGGWGGPYDWKITHLCLRVRHVPRCAGVCRDDEGHLGWLSKRNITLVQLWCMSWSIFRDALIQSESHCTEISQSRCTWFGEIPLLSIWVTWLGTLLRLHDQVLSLWLLDHEPPP